MVLVHSFLFGCIRIFRVLICFKWGEKTSTSIQLRVVFSTWQLLSLLGNPNNLIEIHGGSMVLLGFLLLPLLVWGALYFCWSSRVLILSGQNCRGLITFWTHTGNKDRTMKNDVEP